MPSPEVAVSTGTPCSRRHLVNLSTSSEIFDAEFNGLPEPEPDPPQSASARLARTPAERASITWEGRSDMDAPWWARSRTRAGRHGPVVGYVRSRWFAADRAPGQRRPNSKPAQPESSLRGAEELPERRRQGAAAAAADGT